MRGEVLHYDEAQGFGFITGADGNRYSFAREGLRREAKMSKGTAVEFRPDGGQARDIFAIRATPQASVPHVAMPTAPAPAVAPSYPQPAQEPAHFGRAAVYEPANTTGLWDYFLAAVTRNYANFRGRARRKEYWGFVLFSAIGLFAVAIAGIALDSSMGNADEPYLTATLGGLFVLGLILPSIALSVRRQHDIGLSGWFYLLVFLPYVGNFILFVFSLIPTQMHENKWGPVPQGIRIPQPYSPPPPQQGAAPTA